MADDIHEREIEAAYVRGSTPWPTGFRLFERERGGRISHRLVIHSGSSLTSLDLPPILAQAVSEALGRAVESVPDGQSNYEMLVVETFRGEHVPPPGAANGAGEQRSAA